jgi:hypothetical protein
MHRSYRVLIMMNINTIGILFLQILLENKKIIFFLFSQYIEDDEDEQSEDGDGTTSPRPFDR